MSETSFPESTNLIAIMLLTSSLHFLPFSLKSWITRVLDIVLETKAMYNLKSFSGLFLDLFFDFFLQKFLCKNCIKILPFFLRRKGTRVYIKQMQIQRALANKQWAQ